MKSVQTQNAPLAIGPYAQGIVSGNLLFTSGQIALRSDGTFVEGAIIDQTIQVLSNIQGIVEAAGGTKDNIIKTTVFLKNLDDFVEMNKVYEDFFATHRPARSTVQVAKLPRDALVEIEAIAELS